MKQTLCMVLLFAFFGITNLQAQTDKQAQPNPDHEVLKARLHAGLARSYQHKAPVNIHVDQAQVSSKYNGRDAEILGRLNAAQIPSDFPVYDGTSTNELYTEQIEKWYKANPTLLKKGTNTNEQK